MSGHRANYTRVDHESFACECKLVWAGGREGVDGW